MPRYQYDMTGLVTLISLMLLLWYFVKCGLITGRDGMTNDKYTDAKYEFGPLPKGKIGDVTVYFNETSDNAFANRWRAIDQGLYVHNRKTFWKDVNTPNEMPYWLSQEST